LEQITRTTRCRRMTLHLLQIRLTDARTFIRGLRGFSKTDYADDTQPEPRLFHVRFSSSP